MRGAKGAVLPLKKLVSVVRGLRRQGRTVAFTNGCFDILHVGHLDSLERIKKKADVLIVALNSDASVRRLKGVGRPLVRAKERARLLAALEPVDFVTIFSEDTPLKVIWAIRPDVLAKGGDWRPEQIVGSDIVKASGGRVISVPYMPGHSTTRLIKNIRVSGTI